MQMGSIEQELHPKDSFKKYKNSALIHLDGLGRRDETSNVNKEID